MKAKKWTYHKSHSYFSIRDDEKVSMITQLYQTGVYAIVNNDPKQQFSFNPKDIVKIEKLLQKDYDNGKIKDLVFGVPITVTTENGLYVKCDE